METRSQDEIREIMSAEFERRERIKKYYNYLLLYAVACVLLFTAMVFVGKKILIVALVGLAICFIGTVVAIIGILKE